MTDFPHLRLREALIGNFKFKGFPRQKIVNPTTQANLDNRKAHGESLSARALSIETSHNAVKAWRAENGFPDMPDEKVIPVFLQVDPEDFDIECLKGFGIEIISEEEGGFIIGASTDQFKSLRGKIEKFINDEGKAKNTSQLWEIIEGNGWREEQILSDELLRKWQVGIDDEEMFIIDISIANYLKGPDYPRQKKKEADKHYEGRLLSWKKRNNDYWEKKDEIEYKRQDEIESFIERYGGAVLSSYVSFEDSFGFRAELSGIALKDFVLNYPYVFEVAEHIEFESVKDNGEVADQPDLDLISPQENAPQICIIDSGIMEGHRLLAPAIITDQSISFVPLQPNTTADQVSNGGHGTKVAGAALYGNNIPRSGEHQLPFFLLNARVLDEDKNMSSRLFPPQLMKDITDYHNGANILNMSLNNIVPCRTVHMSQWAATLDQLSHNEEKLFVVSAGNLSRDGWRQNNPGIQNHLQRGRNYPAFLLEPSSRIADPAQSLFALTVGSVCLDGYEDADLISFGKKDEISSFSRTGLGLWGAIKPEVVEYGGDWVRERNGNNLSFKENTCPELVKTGDRGIGRSDVGTSYAAPKVSHIAGQLAALFPDKNALFYKALIIQSARLPEQIFHAPTADHLRMYGYGIPSLSRAIQNDVQRITFTSSGYLSATKAHLYSIKIPEEIRLQGEEYEILVEVTLCYTAKPRRTRRKLNSYLSSWLSWQSAPLNKTFDEFKEEVLKSIEKGEEAQENQNKEQNDNISWYISQNPNHGKIKGIKRQASANQKDWTILKGYNLPSTLSFAIIGRKGWKKDINEELPYSFVVSFEIMNAEIPLYELMQEVNVEVEIDNV